MLNNFFFIRVSKFVCDISGLTNYLIWSFSEWLFLLEVPFCVVKYGIETNVPIFKSVAGLNREMIWLFMFCLCNSFFVFLSDKFRCVSYLYLKSNRCVYQKLILKSVDDESGLDHEYVVINCKKLNLYLVGKNFVHFYWRLL